LLEETVKAFGGVDILVSNAAVNPTFGPAVDCPEDAWDKIFDVNVKAPFLLTREALPLLSRSKNGPNIVYVTSIAGYQPFAVRSRQFNCTS
jgi:dehydrogenase/reductase SDR family protein 4